MSAYECVCALKYVSHVRFFWTTGISNLITPPAPDLRSLGRRTGGAANCYLQHLKQHTITLSFPFPLARLSLRTCWVSPDRPGSRLHSGLREELIGMIWSILFLSRNIMQVLPFYDFLWALYTELQRVFVDIVETDSAFKCEKNAWCAHSIKSFVREMAFLRTPFNFLCPFIVQNDHHSRPTPNCEQH